MTGVNQTVYTQAAYQSAAAYEAVSKSTSGTRKGTDTQKAGQAEQSNPSVEDEKKIAVDGNTYGSPKLSEKALSYYNELRKRYGNLNFVLVSSDKKQEAEMLKGCFANSKNLTVLIDTDKIERMAEDEAFRAKYEGIIGNAASGLSQMKKQMGSKASQVKSYGMTFDKTGLPSFFAVIDKSLAAQRKRIEERAEKKAEEKKKDARKTEKEREQERLEEERAAGEADTGDTVTITANSVEELMKKMDEYYQQEAFGRVRTEEEKAIGAQVDYSI